MANNTERGASFPWGRDFAPVAAIVVAVAGSAWVIADAIGELKAEVVRNAVLIERNAEAIGELKESVARLEVQYGELNESIAQLSGQYAEHIREHGGLAAR